jgi:hypothetical protein
MDSPWSMPWFFIKKKDGALQPIQDYREVNKWTVHDIYPIPCIEQILEGLHGKELFMALDIQWGYNNIHIREEDWWKAVSWFQGTVARSELSFTCSAQVLSFVTSRREDAQGKRSRRAWIEDEVETEALNAT